MLKDRLQLWKERLRLLKEMLRLWKERYKCVVLGTGSNDGVR